MSKAKKLTVDELKALPWGGVAWRESRGEFDCGDRGIIKFYDVFPVMKTFSIQNDDEYVLVSGERYEDDVKIDNIQEDDVYWDMQPDPEQMEPGLMPWKKAAKIFNEYEAEIFQ